MNIISNVKLIDRNRKIGSYTMLAGMVILIGGLVISVNQIATGFQSTQTTNPNTEMMFNYSTIAMLAGLVLTEISMYFNNRWGRKPSMEEKINLGLKGLDDRYSVYLHRGPVPNLLVGPAGIWVIVPMYQQGIISLEKGHYQQSGVSWFTRTFYQEGIGQPEAVAQARIQDLNKFIKQNVPDANLPAVQAVVVFTAQNANVIVEEEEAPFPAMHVDKLKDFVRRKAKEQPAATAALKPLLDALPPE